MLSSGFAGPPLCRTMHSHMGRAHGYSYMSGWDGVANGKRSVKYAEKDGHP